MADHKAEANRLIAYHSPIAQALSAERTSLESKLIPVTAYVITACVECWYRYPEMITAIDAAMPAEEIGRIGRRPGTRINTVHLWGVPNFWLLGRKVVAGMGLEANDPDRAFEVLDFWERAARAFRGDGNLQAWDTDDVRPYEGAVAAQLFDGTVAVDDAQRALVKKLNATLVGYLFLMPATPPVRNATFSAAGIEPVLAAAAVRTLPRVASVIPMKPVRPDMMQPRMNAPVRAAPDTPNESAFVSLGLTTFTEVTNTTTARGMMISAIVRNCRFR